MKRIISFTLLTLCMLITSCSYGVNSNSDNSVNWPRTTDISSGIKNNGRAFSYDCDLDFDGEKESVTMEVVQGPEQPWEASLVASAGEFKTELPMIDGVIDRVYTCDIDTEDSVLDIAVITNEASDDPRIRILKYNKDFPLYGFRFNDDGGINQEVWLGYAISYYFNVNADDTITLEMQTPSYGMWSVYKTFAQNNFGTFEEVIPDRYEILPDFMDKAYTGDMSDDELEMWKNGFIKAYSNYDDGTLSIKKGEYVKPIYDDGENKVYVEKEDGTCGWMNIDYAKGYNPAEFNQYFFFLAG